MLQEAAEEYVMDIFEGNICAERVTMMPEDMTLAIRIRGDNK